MNSLLMAFLSALCCFEPAMKTLIFFSKEYVERIFSTVSTTFTIFSESMFLARDDSFFMPRLKRKLSLDILQSFIITAKPKAHAFKNEMCFPLTKTKCELKKHPNSKFECFFNDFNRTRTSLFLPFPSKLIQDNLVCVLELQE